MTLKELEIFVKAANCQNLTELSKQLEMTQPNISTTIKSLENKLKEKLFDRIGKQLSLNEKGRLLYDKVTPILNELRELQNNFDEKKIAGTLKIASTTTISIYVLPHILYEYIKSYNEVEIKHFSNNTNEVISMVKKGEADIGFIESEEEDADITGELIKEDQLIVVSGDEKLTGKTYCIHQLFHKDWILREKSSGIREMFFDYLPEIKQKLNVVLELQHTLAIKSLLKKYPNTISCLTLESVESELKNGGLYQVKIKNMDFSRRYYLIYRKSKFRNAVFNSFKEFLFANINILDKNKKSVN